jgi:hypothetical protein
VREAAAAPRGRPTRRIPFASSHLFKSFRNPLCTLIADAKAAAAAGMQLKLLHPVLAPAPAQTTIALINWRFVC